MNENLEKEKEVSSTLYIKINSKWVKMLNTLKNSHRNIILNRIKQLYLWINVNFETIGETTKED